MRIKHANEITAETVKGGTGTSRQVLIGPDEAPNFALRRFIMEPGGGIPAHTNAVEHEQYVLAGRAKIGIGDKVHEVEKDQVEAEGAGQHLQRQQQPQPRPAAPAG